MSYAYEQFLPESKFLMVAGEVTSEAFLIRCLLTLIFAGMFNSIFDGRVVAKLPFTPISWIQGISHRSLLGNDATDCR